MSGEPHYRSRVRVVQGPGALRFAFLPAESEPTHFGTHSPVEEQPGTPQEAEGPHATTLDHLVAATAGWLLATLKGALEAREIEVAEGQLTGDAVGDVELEGGVPVLKRLHTVYHLALPPERRGEARRAHAYHIEICPMARTLKGRVAISTELKMEGPAH